MIHTWPGLNVAQGNGWQEVSGFFLSGGYGARCWEVDVQCN